MKTLLLCLLAACAVSAACGGSVGTGGNSPPKPLPSGANQTTAADERTTPAAKAPTPAEARSALERVYKLAVVFDEGRPDPFVAGDFNGDGSGDLAVAVRPAVDRLGEINDELANWIVADPRQAIPFDPNKAAQPAPRGPGPVKIEQSDELLAVVHGHGPEGWRSPEATQSYLLKGVAAQGMRAVPVKNFPPAFEIRRSVNLRADVISGRLAGADGFLYWSRGKYVWHQR